MKNFNNITYLHISKILFMEHNANKICKTVISGKEQNLNRQMGEFGISILYVHFGQIQYFFKVLKTYFIIQYFFKTAWESWHKTGRESIQD